MVVLFLNVELGLFLLQEKLRSLFGREIGFQIDRFGDFVLFQHQNTVFPIGLGYLNFGYLVLAQIEMSLENWATR